MSFRNLSPQEMFIRTVNEHAPLCAFREESDFHNWKQATLPRVVATLGDLPPRVEPNPQLLAEWRHDGLKKQRWLIDVGPHIAATLLVNFPDNAGADEKLPAIMCWHGHGGTGKDPVMGNVFTPKSRAQIEAMNYDYGHQMAKHGFVTYAIDWLGMGERRDTNRPNQHRELGTDWCDAYYLHATMLGMTTLGINVVHGMIATDFISSLPGIDSTRLGVMGLSGGGTLTLWSALCDERFKAAEIICYSDLWKFCGFRDLNYCGMQVTPGLYKLVDLPDLQGLLAPLPLLVDIGVYDSCFGIDGAMSCYRQVERIYRHAGAGDRLELELFAGEHAWGGNKSVGFFRRYF